MIEKGLQYLSPQGEWNSLLKTGATAINVSLSEEQVELFFLYWRELQEWNRYTNITAISSPRDTIIKHFLDSLSVIGSIPCSGRLADIGSGGGFPGIPDCDSTARLSRWSLLRQRVKRQIFCVRWCEFSA